MVHRFAGGSEFDDATGEVRRDGAVTRLERQPAAVLALLAARPGDLVTHDEVRRAVWGDETHVNFQDSVHYCVRQIRLALGDRAHDSRFVETIPRRGYRFRADALAMAVAARPRHTVWRRLAIASFLATVAAAVLVMEQRPNNHHQIAVSVLKTVHDLVF